ncbi:hypothetical protein MPTK1_6g00760 [Marchantia polymorpha subsp. ruderalis]|uniref:CCHC-type domain-containing protein n=2 Tax=Marchantia polymorpha TaxID=3197 RepID=A0AAF6BM63_MARPO|nr:hypothetical protein MARPO_0052s0124 [Marchantia polymorpha]BBN13097.1 hypothetical protein Mp_6g00760 [Marchantia polymorpha subsp. ruderalis]|eukprot:PTQ38350.1 hypothetical protein MARPO_0052s0124 [Marchantia polymorpha]
MFNRVVQGFAQQDGDGEAYWAVEVDIYDHNHEPFTDPAVHPQGCPLTEEIVAAMRPRGVSITPRDVYNVNQVERLRILADCSSLIALLDGLEDRPDASYFAQFDAQRQLTHLLIISLSAKEICYRFCARKVWLIDSTYKTNRFGLPLMHVVGVTATHQSFIFAYCFMVGERAKYYLWTLWHIQHVFAAFLLVPKTFVTDRDLTLMNTLSTVFSDDINVNFLVCPSNGTKAKTSSPSSERTLQASQLSKFLNNTGTTWMQEILPHHVMIYLEETWLLYKYRFVVVFLRNKMDFDYTTTARVESAHAAVKSWIVVEQCPRGFVDALKITFKQHKQQLGTSLENDEDNDVECHGMFTSNMGMSCRHKFRQATATTRATPAKPPRVLSLEDFDSHWWLVQPPRQEVVLVAPTSIEESMKRIQEEFEEGTLYRQGVILDHLDVLPAAEVFNTSVQHGRGRHVGALGHQSQSSTQHDPSREVVENSLRPLRRCGNCGEVGHNKRNCRQLLRTTPAVTASATLVATTPATTAGVS